MKESTSHLQERVQLLEEQNRIVLHFSQACHTRLLRLEAEHGWEPPGGVDPATTLSAYMAASVRVAAGGGRMADLLDTGGAGGGSPQNEAGSPREDEERDEGDAARAAAPPAADSSYDSAAAVSRIYQVIALTHLLAAACVETPAGSSSPQSCLCVVQAYNQRTKALAEECGAKIQSLAGWDSESSQFTDSAETFKSEPVSTTVRTAVPPQHLSELTLV